MLHTVQLNTRSEVRLSCVTLGPLVALSSLYPASTLFYLVIGLADTLRNELKLYGITVHAYFPATILSPGLDLENKTKPELCKKIEGDSSDMTPEACAAALVKGMSDRLSSAMYHCRSSRADTYLLSSFLIHQA